MILWKYWWKAQSWPEAYLFRVSQRRIFNFDLKFLKIQGTRLKTVYIFLKTILYSIRWYKYDFMEMLVENPILTGSNVGVMELYVINK
jgi:hypothetical protein